MDSLTCGTHCLVHLDMKGAPLKVAFFEKFFPFIKSIGATGVLIEWEDTFPYDRELSVLGSRSALANSISAPYSYGEAKQILILAEDCDLLVIPLVQTFGHMEFTLKHDRWAHLREVEAYPSSMCPSNCESLSLACSMIRQIIAFHENLQYIHIGADEVWHLGRCQACMRRMPTLKYGKASLYLDHLCSVAQFIRDNYPGLKIIIWDDMLRAIDERILHEYQIGGLVEPMIWHYNTAETFNISAQLWQKYGNVFPNIWGGTCFKGATSSCQVLPFNRQHISNHEGWLAALTLHSSKIRHFRGIVITGWSRYDHYATLCEMLPCSIPSLLFCITTWFTGGYNMGVYNTVHKLLGYAAVQEPLYLDPPVRPIPLPARLTFPGWEVLLAMEWFLNVQIKYKNIVESDQLKTWLNSWQVRNHYTNPMQLDNMLPPIKEIITEMNGLEGYISANFGVFFYPPTIDEILGTLITPMKQHLLQLRLECEIQIGRGPGLVAPQVPIVDNSLSLD